MNKIHGKESTCYLHWGIGNVINHLFPWVLSSRGPITKSMAKELLETSVEVLAIISAVCICIIIFNTQEDQCHIFGTLNIIIHMDLLWMIKRVLIKIITFILQGIKRSLGIINRFSMVTSKNIILKVSTYILSHNNLGKNNLCEWNHNTFEIIINEDNYHQVLYWFLSFAMINWT